MVEGREVTQVEAREVEVDLEVKEEDLQVMEEAEQGLHHKKNANKNSIIFKNGFIYNFILFKLHQFTCFYKIKSCPRRP